MNRYASALVATAERLMAEAGALNGLDAIAGDGDLGVTVRQAAGEMVSLAPTLEAATPSDGLRAIGLAIARAAPSTAGSLIAAGLIRASQNASSAWTEDAHGVAALLAAVCSAVAERGGARQGSKTMLDALVPAADAALGRVGDEQSVNAALTRAADAADAGARATASMYPRHGRAGWLAERSRGHEDAGARLIAIVLRAYADALRQ